jgi:hypothetical protein
MTELVQTSPHVYVAPAEYYRLLGYPRDAELSERAAELAEWAREWYEAHGNPWIYARRAASLSIADGAVEIDGVAFSSSRLRTALQQAEAHTIFLAAAGAGPEAEEEAQKLWREEKPDEYFFLEMFASAVVENLITTAGASLCAWADAHGMAVLPHHSPGYSQWDVAEQGRLLQLIRRNSEVTLPGPLEALDSGALRPKKSQLAVFGITRHLERVAHLADLVPCQQCALTNCQYRRAPYLRARRRLEQESPAPAASTYSINAKALRRWAAERLVLESREDGTLHARFRYDGTTCTNMGRPLAFHYDVVLGPRQEGYPIRCQTCAPVAGDVGHTAMCQYITGASGLMAAIGREQPLAGRPLAEVLTWHRPEAAAGCYCEAASREHKWGLVLETIHYALHNSESHADQR